MITSVHGDFEEFVEKPWIPRHKWTGANLLYSFFSPCNRKSPRPRHMKEVLIESSGAKSPNSYSRPDGSWHLRSTSPRQIALGAAWRHKRLGWNVIKIRAAFLLPYFPRIRRYNIKNSMKSWCRGAWMAAKWTGANEVELLSCWAIVRQWRNLFQTCV
jgi:hypothetical protein